MKEIDTRNMAYHAIVMSCYEHFIDYWLNNILSYIFEHVNVHSIIQQLKFEEDVGHNIFWNLLREVWCSVHCVEKFLFSGSNAIIGIFTCHYATCINNHATMN